MVRQRRARVIVFALLTVSAPRLALSAQELTADDARRVAPYNEYWGLVDTTLPTTADMQDRLNAAIRRAQQEFGGRGPALARYFLRHIQASPDNTAYFFLFRAVGDLDTLRVLALGMIDPPAPEGGALGRDPGEISIGIEGILKNDGVRADPATTAVLQEALVRARQKPGGAWMAGLFVSLLGKCTAPEAAPLLQALASDADPSIRQAAVTALGTTASPAAGETLQRTLVEDRDPEARARAAAALAQQGSADAAAALDASMAREADPRVFDEIVRALTAIQALPRDPRACLAAANRCWDAYVARPLFQCWRATASRDDLIAQATGAGWTVRALALYALADVPAREDRAIAPLLRMPAPPPLAGDQNRRPGVVRQDPPLPLPAVPVFDQSLRDRLLQSAVEVLSRRTSGTPSPDTLSYGTAQFTRDAFWAIAGRDMAVALGFADRIVPVSGRYAPTGRFGESSDLATKDRAAYGRYRRPRQLLAAGVIGVLIVPLLGVRRLRKLSAASLVGLGVWAVWTMFQTSVRELPPFPLVFITASFLGFLAAGVVAGSLSLLHTRRWLRALSAPLLAGIGGLGTCAYTRWAGLFPIGGEGWELVFDPLISAILAVPVALVLSIGLEFWRE